MPWPKLIRSSPGVHLPFSAAGRLPRPAAVPGAGVPGAAVPGSPSAGSGRRCQGRLGPGVVGQGARVPACPGWRAPPQSFSDFSAKRRWRQPGGWLMPGRAGASAAACPLFWHSLPYAVREAGWPPAPRSPAPPVSSPSAFCLESGMFPGQGPPDAGASGPLRFLKIVQAGFSPVSGNACRQRRGGPGRFPCPRSAGGGSEADSSGGRLAPAPRWATADLARRGGVHVQALRVLPQAHVRPSGRGLARMAARGPGRAVPGRGRWFRPCRQSRTGWQGQAAAFSGPAFSRRSKLVPGCRPGRSLRLAAFRPSGKASPRLDRAGLPARHWTWGWSHGML